MGTHQRHAYLLTRQFSFQVSGMLLPIREKLLTESQPNLHLWQEASNKFIKHDSAANECISINRFSLPVPVASQIKSNKTRLGT